MCGRRPSPPPPPPRMLPAPPLKTPPPPRKVPTPEEIKKETEDPNLISGKKRTKLQVKKIKSGVKQFDAIDPGMNVDAPAQGIPSPKA
tara:strand:- start:321 stop:584 length:264 start_codon:yes stop_codon:yes gene_type:complete